MDLNETILQAIDSHGSIDSLKLADLLSVKHQAVVGALKSIQCFENVRKYIIFIVYNYNVTC